MSVPGTGVVLEADNLRGINKSSGYSAVLLKFKSRKEKTKMNAEKSQGSSLIAYLNDTITKMAG